MESKDLAVLADKLDQRGLYREADFVDALLLKQAGFIDTAVIIAQKGLEFVDSVASGSAKIGALIEGSGIPGLAFVGGMLNDAGTITSLAAKLLPVLDDVLSVISKKIEMAKTSRDEVCITLQDFGSDIQDAVRLLLGLLAKASVGPSLSAALAMDEKLLPYTSFIPGLSEAIKSSKNRALALGMCFGGGSNISQDADSVAASIDEQAKNNEHKLEDYANIMAMNMQRPNAPGQPDMWSQATV